MCQYVCIDTFCSIQHACPMTTPAKGAQLQIRVSAKEKALIQNAAVRAGMDMSEYVLSRVLSAPAEQFRSAVAALESGSRFGLAELNSLLSALTADELSRAVSAAPATPLTPYFANYVAAMVELACSRCALQVPTWVRAIEPLSEPAFASNLQSLRLHLLTNSPAAFRSRNVFIDATLGDHV
jgi:uncharacterized protein (DUF1778 family)